MALPTWCNTTIIVMRYNLTCAVFTRSLDHPRGGAWCFARSALNADITLAADDWLSYASEGTGAEAVMGCNTFAANASGLLTLPGGEYRQAYVICSGLLQLAIAQPTCWEAFHTICTPFIIKMNDNYHDHQVCNLLQSGVTSLNYAHKVCNMYWTRRH